jgi:hypothetical protein
VIETLLRGQHAKIERWLAADPVQVSDLQARGERGAPGRQQPPTLVRTPSARQRLT